MSLHLDFWEQLVYFICCHEDRWWSTGETLVNQDIEHTEYNDNNKDDTVQRQTPARSFSYFVQDVTRLCELPKRSTTFVSNKNAFFKNKKSKQTTDSTNKKTTDNKFHPTPRAFHSFFLNILCGVEKHRLFCLNLFSVGQCTRPHFWSSVVVSKKHDVQVSKTLVNAPTARKDA